MNTLRGSYRKAMIAAVYAVVMLFSGFTHEPEPLRAADQSAALRSQDGTKVTLCQASSPGEPGRGEQGPAAPGPGYRKALWRACLLASAAGALSAPPLTPPPTRSLRLAIAREKASATKIFAMARRSRGPPQA